MHITKKQISFNKEGTDTAENELNFAKIQWIFGQFPREELSFSTVQKEYEKRLPTIEERLAVVRGLALEKFLLLLQNSFLAAKFLHFLAQLLLFRPEMQKLLIFFFQFRDLQRRPIDCSTKEMPVSISILCSTTSSLLRHKQEYC